MESLLSQPLFASGAVTLDLDLTMVVHLVLFTGFVVIMKALVFDPLLRVFEERERRTVGAVAAARGMDEQAIALKAELEGKLEGVRHDAAADRERARARIASIEAERKAQTRDEAQRKLAAGLDGIQQEVGQIRKDLEAQRQELALQITATVLGRKVQP